ncbi:lytic transglycosylase domain-containing protein [Leifsonia sp. fls2-241-R2A-40a]|uniref:aggregation-promoting factor C-terminal-like domain-containing protein n=1 Tax=Leifsonia sp. fls2-241-R2A-40a TaxID=3040290 RepID=UPI00254B2BD1|nr:lytic transglycosylase domain-containing protein [Leifsonia sp. fls2-241-R2A-40a]
MGRRAADIEPLTPANPVGVAFKRSRRPHIRSRAALLGFAFTAAVGFALVNVVDPFSGTTTTPAYAESLQEIPTTQRYDGAPAQQLTAPDSAGLTITRDAVTVKEKPKPTPTPTPTPVAKKSSSSDSGSSYSAPSAPIPSPGTAKDIAYQMMQQRGWGDDQWGCLDQLWSRESGWRVNASNPSGAYGIPQALPGSKMGPGWQTDASVQISWGLGYIGGRYGNPCGAWAHSESSGWY